jgi:hypothetical protein
MDLKATQGNRESNQFAGVDEHVVNSRSGYTSIMGRCSHMQAFRCVRTSA